MSLTFIYNLFKDI